MRLIWQKLLTLTDYTLIINYYKMKIPKAVTKRVVSEKAHSESKTVIREENQERVGDGESPTAFCKTKITSEPRVQKIIFK